MFWNENKTLLQTFSHNSSCRWGNQEQLLAGIGEAALAELELEGRLQICFCSLGRLSMLPCWADTANGALCFCLVKPLWIEVGRESFCTAESCWWTPSSAFLRRLLTWLWCCFCVCSKLLLLVLGRKFQHYIPSWHICNSRQHWPCLLQIQGDHPAISSWRWLVWNKRRDGKVKAHPSQLRGSAGSFSCLWKQRDLLIKEKCHV